MHCIFIPLYMIQKPWWIIGGPVYSAEFLSLYGLRIPKVEGFILAKSKFQDREEAAENSGYSMPT